MDQLNKFRIVSDQEKQSSNTIKNSYICVDPNGIPFKPGTDFIPWAVDEYIGCQEESALNYLRDACKWLTYLFFEFDESKYLAPPDEIRRIMDGYLTMRLGLDIRPFGGDKKVIYSSDKNKGKRQITLNTAKLFIQGVKWFYEFLILNGYYKGNNPFSDPKSILKNKQKFVADVPRTSGVGKRKRYGREPETYYIIARGIWQPNTINDPNLKNKLVPFFEFLVDRIIARIAFEGGPRGFEIVAFNIGDWRELHGLRPGAKAINKGSRGNRVKEVYWLPETDRMIFTYCHGKRKEHDRLHRDLDELPDDEPLFINKNGDRQTLSDFNYEWGKACKKAHIELTLHQARHWFVTRFLMTIYKQVKETGEDPEPYRRSLIQYMHWAVPETIDAYDHMISKWELPAEIMEVIKKIGRKDKKTEIVEHGEVRTSPQANRVSAPTLIDDPEANHIMDRIMGIIRKNAHGK